MFYGLHNYFFNEDSGALSLILGGFTLWMLIDCLRKDPDRQIWWWIIIVVPVIGPLAYFFIRWLPERHVRPPGWLRGFTRGNELRRLESAAMRIGNSYHHNQLGDALLDIGQYQRAGTAYSRALEKEPGNLTALWGAALVDMHFQSFDSAASRLEKVLKSDPQFKFGDASLALAKSLIQLDRPEEAITHLEAHAKRWRHPEGIYLLAQLLVRFGRTEEARNHLHSMLADIDASPLAIARKQSHWRRRGQKLLRSLG